VQHLLPLPLRSPLITTIRYYLELNTKQRKEWEQRLEELKKAAEEEVDERLDASVRRILQQNRRMAEELRIHVQVRMCAYVCVGV
jgi:F0F1-type ATP synthase membrane subunit b/b'